MAKSKISDGLSDVDDAHDSDFELPKQERKGTKRKLHNNNRNSNSNSNSNSKSKSQTTDVIVAGSGCEYFLTEFKASLQIDDCFHWSSLSYYGECVVYRLEKIRKKTSVAISSEKASSVEVDIRIDFYQTSTNRLNQTKKQKQ